MDEGRKRNRTGYALLESCSRVLWMEGWNIPTKLAEETSNLSQKPTLSAPLCKRHNITVQRSCPIQRTILDFSPSSWDKNETDGALPPSLVLQHAHMASLRRRPCPRRSESFYLFSQPDRGRPPLPQSSALPHVEQILVKRVQSGIRTQPIFTLNIYFHIYYR